MKTVLAMMLLCACLTAGAQSIEIYGPVGAPPDAVLLVFWDQLAGHSATLEHSEDMAVWMPLAGYSVATTTVWHLNYVPEWAGSHFFRTVQTVVVPPVFAMLPEDAFR